MKTNELIEEGKKMFARTVKDKGRLHEDAHILSALISRLRDKHELSERRLDHIHDYEFICGEFADQYGKIRKPNDNKN